MNLIHLPSVTSTSTYLQDLLHTQPDLEEWTIVCSDFQTAGRGQKGNSWESADGQNLLFSILLRPTFLPAQSQFLLSETISLSIAEVLNQWHEGFCIKWPNDIYHDDRKVAGILIETSIMGKQITQCTIGIGININQTDFESEAPNPVSLRTLIYERLLHDTTTSNDMFAPCYGNQTTDILRGQNLSRLETELPAIPLDNIFTHLISTIQANYQQLQQDPAIIEAKYAALLYRRNGFHPYIDVRSGAAFDAKILRVEPCGKLHLKDTNGDEHTYMFKELHFVLPCGISKE